MLPGTLAGQYEPREMQIDLVRLCASCGVRFVQARALGLDLPNRRLLVEKRPAIDFDLLSVGIGSRPTIPLGGEEGLSIKPMQTFLPRLTQMIDAARAREPHQVIHIAVVGGGAAGVEIAFCVHEFLRRAGFTPAQSKITLVEAGEHLLSGMPARTRRLTEQELTRRGIQLLFRSRVSHVEEGKQLVFENGNPLSVDAILWATAAEPPKLLGELNLPLDDRGFLLTRNTLQSTGCDEVFAVGDSGTVEGEQYAKAGVYAVRQGPILWKNLHSKLRGEQLTAWRPQTRFLSLLNTGDDRAILTYGAISSHSQSAWWLKHWIDSRFMEKYQQYDFPMMALMKSTSEDEADAMQCGGCGSKASPLVLQQSLPSLNQPKFEHVLLGLDEPDDVALLKQGDRRATAVSTDFFTSFVDDPYLLGRIAALNALSDLFVKGATPKAALSIAVLPPGLQQQQSRLLDDLLAGATRELAPVGVPIVGGHSIVGPKLTFGFTIVGETDLANVLRKSTVTEGDRLVLTKPLGTGILLAAHMQAACRAEWWTPLLDAMLQSNLAAAEVAAALPVSAATDVTGFGLAGHLREMLANSDHSAEISLGSLPLLPGTQELLNSGFESTLAPSNRESCEVLQIAPELHAFALTKILFDPQTSGGLLLAVPEEKLDGFISKCKSPTAVIGRIVKAASCPGLIHLGP